MSVSHIASGINTGLNQANFRGAIKEGRQDFSQLLGSLQSGDVSGAQQAFAAMQQLLPGLQTGTQATANQENSAQAASTTNAVRADFSALGSTLNSGSLSAAQDAVAKLQQDAQAYRQEHHKFGSVEHAQGVYKAMQQGMASSSTSSHPIAASGPNSSLNADLAALGQALQTGSMTSAQDAFAKLQQDLQSAQRGQGSEHRHPHTTSGMQNLMSSYIANSILGNTATAASSTGNSVAVSA